jgi:hypothetical protein
MTTSYDAMLELMLALEESMCQLHMLLLLQSMCACL